MADAHTADARPAMALVLASGSRTRYDMMKAAGLAFTVDPADIDEQAVRDECATNSTPADPRDVAITLARAKAMAVSPAHPDEIVIGADQILALGTEIFTKPNNRDEAAQTLKKLRGREHVLHTAVAIAINGKVSWNHVATAHMKMRNFSDEFAADYLVHVGDDAFHSVGAYQLEGRGIQLFDDVKGDYFTILGLPLLPLLTELRAIGVLEK